MPDSIEAVLVLTAFLLPGYVAALVFTRGAPRAEVSDLRLALQIAFWASLVHLVIAAFGGDFLFRFVGEFRTLFSVAVPQTLAVAAAYLLLLPIALGFTVRFISELPVASSALKLIGLSRGDRTPTAWDFAFAPGRKGAWLLVYVRNQPEPLVGEFGVNSMAGVSPNDHDLFLERRYELNSDGPPTAVPLSRGMWIAAESIDFVEFFAVEGEGKP